MLFSFVVSTSLYIFVNELHLHVKINRSKKNISTLNDIITAQNGIHWRKILQIPNY